MGKIVWICIQTREALNHYRGKKRNQREIGGVFSTEKKAYNYAKKYWGFWIGPIEIDKAYPLTAVPIENGYYPYDMEQNKNGK